MAILVTELSASAVTARTVEALLLLNWAVLAVELTEEVAAERVSCHRVFQ